MRHPNVGSASGGEKLDVRRACWVGPPTPALLFAPRQRARSRVLGARQITQAVLSGVRPSPEVLAMGVWIDLAHAASVLGLAAADRDIRRAHGRRGCHGVGGVQPRRNEGEALGSLGR